MKDMMRIKRDGMDKYIPSKDELNDPLSVVFSSNHANPQGGHTFDANLSAQRTGNLRRKLEKVPLLNKMQSYRKILDILRDSEENMTHLHKSNKRSTFMIPANLEGEGPLLNTKNFFNKQLPFLEKLPSFIRNRFVPAEDLLEQPSSYPARKILEELIDNHEFAEIQGMPRAIDDLKKDKDGNLLMYAKKKLKSAHVSPDVLLREHNNLSTLGINSRTGDYDGFITPELKEETIRNSRRMRGITGELPILDDAIAKIHGEGAQYGYGDRINRRQMEHLRPGISQAYQEKAHPVLSKLRKAKNLGSSLLNTAKRII